jgi:DNA replication protein DnaC
VLPVEFPAELRAFVNEQTWTFAKTMPEWPHEYIVRDRVDEELFERLVVYIRTHGHEGVRAEADDQSYHDFLATLIAEEVGHRAQTRIERSVRKARFPFLRSIEDFDFTFQTPCACSCSAATWAPNWSVRAGA